MNILVVERDPVATLVLQKALTRLKHTVSHAQTTDLAWRRLLVDTFDVVIASWRGEDIDGVELCRKLRASSMEGYTYVILLDAMAQRRNLIEALRAGADDLLSKPLDTGTLYARLEVASRILQMQKDLQQRSDQLGIMTSALESSNKRMNELFQNAPFPCITIDHQGIVMEWNLAAEALYGLRSSDVYLQPLWHSLVTEEHKEEAIKLVDRVLTEGKLQNIEWSFPQKNGQIRDLLISSYPMKGPNGNVIGASICCIDISDRKALEDEVARQLDKTKQLNKNLALKSRQLEAANSKLRQLATIDGLTGISNVRSFKETFAKAFAEAKRGNHQLSVAMIDVDQFKTFNDKFGHPAGDEVLRTIARLIQDSIRPETDRVGRYGGEEFIILMQHTDAKQAVQTCDRVRQIIAAHKWRLRDMTASFGIASLEPGIDNPEQLISQADKALYVSKEAGRNRVTHCHECLTEKAAA